MTPDRGPHPADETLAPPGADPLSGADVAAASGVRPAFDRSNAEDATLSRAPGSTRADAAPAARPAADDTEVTLFPEPVPPPPDDDVTANLDTHPDAGPGWGFEDEVTQTFAPPVPPAGRLKRAGPGPAVGAAVDRFVVRGLHARGGLGEVFTARDTELNREVALKRIQARYADEPSSRRRFVAEAEITARLDHPGVVPVFGLVADGNGRPCYAMRFIRGESLRDEIDRYYGGPGPGGRGQDSEQTEATGTGRPGRGAAPRGGAADATPDRRLAFRQLLQRFIAVCQAIAYAHTRNVIHRDIKPANVMVGAFGETLVVDWGLAKALDDVPNPDALWAAAERADFRRDADATAPPDDLTAVGTAVGTPAYMSPEQAAGDVDRVGPASDIFSLGATLYCILTGRSPFGGSAPSETLKLVQTGVFPPPRAVNPAAPAPLDAVCRKALAARIEDRYPTAQALAADVERWLSDEPVSCYRDPLPARLARWARRHPARVAGSVSLLGAGLVATAVILGVVDQARKRTQESLAKVTAAEAAAQAALANETAAKAATQAALARVTDEQARTEEQRRAAVSARDLARTRFDLARQGFETVVIGIQSQLDDRAGTQQLRKELLQTARAGLKKLLETASSAAGADRREAERLMFWARLQMGDVRKALGDTAVASVEYAAAVKVAEHTLAADPASLDVRRDLAAGYDRLAEIDLQAGRTAAAASAGRKAADLRVRLLEAAPADPEAKRDLAASRDRLAVVELERGDTRAARLAAAESLAARKELHAAAPADVRFTRDLAQSHERDAEILLRTGNATAAATAVAEALALRTAVAKELPDRVEVQRELAAAHSRLGEVNVDRAEMTAALAAYRAALAVLDATAVKDPLSAGTRLDAAVARGRVGVVLLRTGDAAGALEETRRGNAMCRDLVAADPTSAKARRTLAKSHEYLGDALRANGREAEAVREYEAARQLLDALSTADAGSAGARLDLGEAAERLGAAQLAAGRLAAAVDTLRAAAAVRAQAAEADPGSARAKRDAAVSQERLCDAYLAAGSHVPARVAAYKAFATFRDLAAADPGSGRATRDLAGAYAKWGEVALAQRDATAAMILWHKSLAGYDAVAAVDAANAQAQEDRAAALERLGTVNGAVGYPDAQLAAEREALAVREKLAAAHPDSPTAHLAVMTSKRRVGDALAGRRQFPAARASYEEARAVAAKFHDAPVFAAEIARVTERLALVDAVRAGSQNPQALDEYPADLRARALTTLVSEHLRLREPVSAARAVNLLVAAARGPDDLYAAAHGFAAVAAAVGGAQAKDYADAAVVVLARATAAGFRHADALADPAWDQLRADPAFKAAEAALKALPPLAPPPHAK